MSKSTLQTISDRVSAAPHPRITNMVLTHDVDNAEEGIINITAEVDGRPVSATICGSDQPVPDEFIGIVADSLQAFAIDAALNTDASNRGENVQYEDGELVA